MRYFVNHFVFASILNCSTLTKFQFSAWSSAIPMETESIKKKTQYLKTRYSSVAAGLYIQSSLDDIQTPVKPSKIEINFIGILGPAKSLKTMKRPEPNQPDLARPDGDAL